MGTSGGEHSRQRAQQVQRPWGEHMLGLFKREKTGQCRVSVCVYVTDYKSRVILQRSSNRE